MLFTEVIKLRDGVLYSLEYHKVRMARTLAAFGMSQMDFAMVEDAVPSNCTNGLYKCRVLYSNKIEKIEFTPYSLRRIETVELVADNNIEYSFKYADRGRLNALQAASSCNEIIIVKDGFITDSSYTNLVFKQGKEYFTPKECLLPGTKRQALLDAGIIKPVSIRPKDLSSYESVHFINAMIDIEDNINCSISAISTTLGRGVRG